MQKSNFFAGTIGIITVGIVIGLCALALQASGNPGNMGICVVCFERDTAGAIGLHSTHIVQYLRPEIIGLVLGAFVAAFLFKEFNSRGGSSPFSRFALGVVAAIGALVFLGCPWRAVLRLAGGDLNAILGIAGLIVGIFIGTQFFKQGFSLGKSVQQNKLSGIVFPLVMLALLSLYFLFPEVKGEAKSGILNYSQSGPGSQHAPVFLSLALAFVIGFLAQRSRFCTMGAFRDIILFRYFHLFLGVLAFFATVLIGNIILGNLNIGFEGQPVAHSDGLWNFLGMVTAGLAFALAGGCPGRQLFMSGEGDSDAAIFAIGVLVGTALAHNFMTASSPAGIALYGGQATIIAFVVCLVIGFINIKKFSGNA